MKRLARISGTLLIAAGALTLVWVVVVWRWQDPFTAVYTHFQQERLARAYGRALRPGDAVGRLKIGRIGLNMIVVQGTSHETLKRGPGHYVGSGLPGEGHLIYIAGHRTTYLAPFAYIDDIRRGDYVELQVPYGTFTYRVVRHYVVRDSQVSVLRDHGREILRLQACHPRFFATHRYIVDAKLVGVAPRGASPFTVRAQAS
jgi:sortase A